MNFWCDMVFEVKTWEGLKQSKETTCNTPYYISFPRLKQCKETNIIFKWLITNENYRSANNRFRVKFGLVVWSYRVKRVSPSTKKMSAVDRKLLLRSWLEVKSNKKKISAPSWEFWGCFTKTKESQKDLALRETTIFKSYHIRSIKTPCRNIDTVLRNS